MPSHHLRGEDKMDMVLKFAFRNIFRNKRRTIITSLSIFFAAVIAVFALGWITGMIGVLMNNYIKYQTGNLRIVSEGFVQREKFFPVDENVPDSEKNIAVIKTFPGIASAEERIKFTIMLGKEDRSTYAIGMGLDLENSIMNISKAVLDKNGKNSGKVKLHPDGLYIGEGLAKKLGVIKGDKLLIAARTSEGGLNGIKLEISGLLRTGIASMDARYFYVGLKEAKKLLKLKDATTEIFVYFKPKADEKILTKRIKELLEPGIKLQTPREQIGSYYDMLRISIIIFYFFMAGVLFMASFVIINTMIMSIFERIKEIGTLKAIGMTDKELFINFTIEGGIIGAMGGIAGSFIGLLLVWFSGHVGIDMGASMKNINIQMDTIIRPAISWSSFLICLISTMIIPSLASMIPATYVKRFMPAEALKKI